MRLRRFALEDLDGTWEENIRWRSLRRFEQWQSQRRLGVDGSRSTKVRNMMAEPAEDESRRIEVQEGSKDGGDDGG
jgi:hypothetical protein